MIRHRVSALFAVALCGCASVGNQLGDVVFMPNKNSARQEGERVELHLIMETAPPGHCQERPEVGESVYGSAVVSPSASGLLVDLLFNTVSQTLKAEEGRYVADYSASGSTDAFFTEVDDDDEVKVCTMPRVAGLRLSRTIVEKGKNDPVAAADICAVTVPGRNGASLHVVPIAYHLRRSKAKVIGFDWTSPFGVDLLNPWEIVTDPLGADKLTGIPADDDLSLTTAFRFDYLHYAKDGALKTTASDPKTVTVKDVPLAGGAAFFPAFKTYRQTALAEGVPPRAADLCSGTGDAQLLALRRKIVERREKADAHRMRLLSQALLFPMPPQSLGNTGNAVVTIVAEVTETDDFGKRVKTVSTAFEKDKKSLQEEVTKLLGQ